MRDCWVKNAALISSSFDGTNEVSHSPEENKIGDNPPNADAGYVEQSDQIAATTENENEIESDTGSAVLRHTDWNESPVNDILRQLQFFVHGSWLALQSSYFRSLFFSGMKESSCKEVHMKISESEEKAHLLLLESMYKVDRLDNVSVDELLAVLELAHKYDAKFVFRKCKYVLQATELSLQVCEKIISFIKIQHVMTDVEDLAATLQAFLVKEFSPLDKTWQTKSFRNLSQLSLKYLLSSDKLITQSENTVFHALMHWHELNSDGVTVKDPETPLLSLVRFELMPIYYLYTVVQHHPIATKMADFNRHYLKGVTYHALTSEMKERLEVKPNKRDAIDEAILQYTWIVQKDKIDEVISQGEKKGKTLTSDVFWCCGYRMRMFLENVEKERRSRTLYKGMLGLQAVGLAKESVLPVTWTSTSKMFPKKGFNWQHKCKFTEERSKSPFPVTFTLQDDNEENLTTDNFNFNGSVKLGPLRFGGPPVLNTRFPLGSSSSEFVTTTQVMEPQPCVFATVQQSLSPVTRTMSSLSIDLSIELE